MMRGATRRRRRQEQPCRVYWGGHGCKKHRGHQSAHVCQCGDVYRGGPPCFGEDAFAVNADAAGHTCGERWLAKKRAAAHDAEQATRRAEEAASGARRRLREAARAYAAWRDYLA